MGCTTNNDNASTFPNTNFEVRKSKPCNFKMKVEIILPTRSLSTKINEKMV